jgi:CubicO group peptidase (beta-lactamase class C family)
VDVAGRGPRERVWSAASTGSTLATRFDLASLTKPFVATLALVLDARGDLPLTTRVGDIWAGASSRLARQPLASLLRHRSGLAAWAPLYAVGVDRRAALRWLLAAEARAPLPTYSDLGYLLWGFTAEAVLGRPLWALLRQRVAAPLSLEGLGAPGRRRQIAPCAIDGRREQELAAGQGLALPNLGPPGRGEPQDGNARWLLSDGGAHPSQGIAGHAGLFGTVDDVAGLAAEWLAPGRLLSAASVAAALGGARPLGWSPRRVRGASAGLALPASGFGHVGFTGGSVWCDPERRRIYTLLAHRRAVDVRLEAWRRRFHRLASAA